MVQERVVIERLLNRKRVDITPLNYLKRCKRQMFVHVLVFLSAIAAILLQFGVTFISLGVSAGLLFSLAMIFLYFLKRTKSVAVKGDTLILNSFNKRSCVTSLRSIKNVNTHSFLGIQWTRMCYKLDGVTRSAFFINRSWAVVSTPEQLIKKAIQLSKKKKKANHKPDSVSL